MERYRDLVRLLVSLMLAGAFVLAGGLKLVGSPDMIASFAHWGYPIWFMYAVGLLEVTAVAATAIAGVMLGAMGTQVVHGEYGSALIPVALLAMASWLAWTTRPVRFGGHPHLLPGEFAAAMPDLTDDEERPNR